MPLSKLANTPPPRPEIRRFYETQARESQRLSSGRSAIEFERQKDILSRILPRPPACILDVGGGPGTYSLWLARQGYDVHLVDPVELQVRQARQRARRRGLRLDAQVGDARRLLFPDRFADALLLMGPLYHLTESRDRAQSLQEAHRVLRPKGILAAVGISRFTSMLDGAWQGFVRDPRFRRIIRNDLRTGQHRNPTRFEPYFTTAFFHHPDELRQELRRAGFVSVKVIASEGFLWWAPDILRYWRDASMRRFLNELSRAVEEEPALLGMGPHLMAVGLKKGR